MRSIVGEEEAQTSPAMTVRGRWQGRYILTRRIIPITMKAWNGATGHM